MPSAIPTLSSSGLTTRAQLALGMTQRQLAELLGSSPRTAQRWSADQSSPSYDQWKTLAAAVYPRDRDLSAQIAAKIGQTLESLGLKPPSPPPATVAAAVPDPDLVPLLVESLVCAAADALDVSPRSVRGALHAAFNRARASRLGVDVIADALAPKAPRKENDKGKR